MKTYFLGAVLGLFAANGSCQAASGSEVIRQSGEEGFTWDSFEAVRQGAQALKESRTRFEPMSETGAGAEIPTSAAPWDMLIKGLMAVTPGIERLEPAHRRHQEYLAGLTPQNTLTTVSHPLKNNPQAPQAGLERSYDLSAKSRPAQGQRLARAIEISTEMKVTFQPVQGQPRENIAAQRVTLKAEETLRKVEGGRLSESLVKISKASKLSNGAETALSFEGQNVIVTSGAGSSSILRLEGGAALSREDEATAKLVATRAGVFESGTTGTDVLLPSQPVKVGESWEPDLARAAKDLLASSKLPVGVDLQKSSARFTLMSVESRDGIEYGKIQGTVELAANKFGSNSIDPALLLKVSIEAEIALEGQAPDGTVNSTAELIGATTVSPPGGGPSGVLTVDTRVTTRTSVKLVK